MKNMDDIAKIEAVQERVDAAGLPSDRRRLGRSAVSPELIPLLRGEPGLQPERNDLQPILGVAYSLLISALCYGAIWAAVAYFFLWHAHLR